MARLGMTASRIGAQEERGGGFAPGAPLLRRLERCGALSDDDRSLVLADTADARSLAPHQPCIRQGQPPRQVHLVTEGWMIRWQILPDGSRQVTGFLLPGDFCNDPATIEHGFDAGVSALGPAMIASVAPSALERWSERPTLRRALAWARLCDEVVQRSWIVSVGRRDAYGRLAYLLCQLHARLSAIGEAHDQGFLLPATQEHLADALGLTPVHVNRVLKRLREDGMVEIRRTRVHLPDVGALRDRAGFAERDVHLSAAPPAKEKTSWSASAWA